MLSPIQLRRIHLATSTLSNRHEHICRESLKQNERGHHAISRTCIESFFTLTHIKIAPVRPTSSAMVRISLSKLETADLCIPAATMTDWVSSRSDKYTDIFYCHKCC